MTDDELLEELTMPNRHNLHDSALGVYGESHLVPANHLLSYGGQVGSHERLIIFYGDDSEPNLVCVIEE